MNATGVTHRILDAGYLKLDEFWGSDEKIVRAARMSTGKGFLGWDPGPCDACSGTGKITEGARISNVQMLKLSLGAGVEAGPDVEAACYQCEGSGKLKGDAKLLKYLYDNWHHTPFEMAGLIVEVQAPIETFRQWHRHRTQSYNEMSARYVPLPDLNYIPTPGRLMVVSGTNKQAAGVGGKTLTHEQALEWLMDLAEVYDHAEAVYKKGLDWGVPKEIARLPVPVGRYSRMMASTCLRNWLAFLTLRSDRSPRGAHAQWEIRQYANAVGLEIKNLFPRTWELFTAWERA